LVSYYYSIFIFLENFAIFKMFFPHFYRKATITVQ
jgi:hypothetical protein